MADLDNKKSPLFLILTVCGFFFVVFVGIIALVLSSIRFVGPSSQKKLFAKGTRIGVVEVNGVIMDSKKTLEYLDRMEEDDSIKGVVLRVNSPGGAVAPSQEIHRALTRLNSKKPVYTSMSSLAASGGYYISCGTKKIFAEPGTITGSIGVIMQFMDLSKLYQWAKFNPYNIKTGKFKDIGSPDREMSADEKALLQGMMDNVLEQFRKAIVEGRKIPYDKVVELSDGRIFSGEQAKSVHLVDELGGLKETAESLVAEVKGEGKPVLMYPVKKRHMLIEKLFDDDDDSPFESDSESRFENHSVLGQLYKLILLGNTLLSAQGSSGLGAVSVQNHGAAAISASGTTWGPMYLLHL